MLNQSRIVTNEHNVIYIDKQITNIMIHNQNKKEVSTLEAWKLNDKKSHSVVCNKLAELVLNHRGTYEGNKHEWAEQGQ